MPNTSSGHIDNTQAAAGSPKIAVTFDAYNTLFDFMTGAREQLHIMLPEEPDEQIERVWYSMNMTFVKAYTKIAGTRRADYERFITLSDFHEIAIRGALEEIGVQGDLPVLVDEWNRYVSSAPLFTDAIPAVEWVLERFPTGIVSDIDTWMLERNIRHTSVPLETFVTSEEDASYKSMLDCTMFQNMAEKLGCAVENIIHVGDSGADILGARRAGARVVWLDRNGHALPESIPAPDATITTLADLPETVMQLCGDRS